MLEGSRHTLFVICSACRCEMCVASAVPPTAVLGMSCTW
jgi:hypothetical protein